MNHFLHNSSLLDVTVKDHNFGLESLRKLNYVDYVLYTEV